MFGLDVSELVFIGAPIFLLGVITLAIYLAPTMLAWRRGHPKRVAIAALNVLLGWTVVGWLAAFLWAIAPDRDARPDPRR